MDHVSVPLTVLEIVGRLSLAIAAGIVVGIDRELHRKPAGLRTHALVALGSGLFTLIALLLAAGQGDPATTSRVVQGLIAGVGFIGAGTIFRHSEDVMGRGLTTAASIWVVAALGTAAGAGLWRMTLVATLMVLGVLLLDPLDRTLRRHAGDADAVRELHKRLE